MFPWNKTVHYEQKLWKSKDHHRFSACILNSSDFCFSPTYSLLCFHSCGAVWLFQEADYLLYLTQTQWQEWWWHDGYDVSGFNVAAALEPLQAHYHTHTGDVHPLSTHMQYFGFLWVHEPVQKITLHQQHKTRKKPYNWPIQNYCMSL